MGDIVKFEKALTALAVYVFAIGEKFEGHSVFYNFGMNGLDLASDILARSKVLEWGEKNRFSAFLVDWRPGQPLPIVRNKEEATEAEFQIAMVHSIRWRTGPNGHSIPIKQNLPTNTPVADSELYDLAFKEMSECLTAWGLGTIGNGQFSLNSAGQATPGYWAYWTQANRDRTATKIRKQNTKKHLKKHFAKYGALYDRY